MTKNREKSSSSMQQGMTAGGGVDRISNLPDCILHHILSFLHTKSAAQTSLLSKQWESTWKHVDPLNLELYFDEYSRYETFVDKVLCLRHPLHVSKVLWKSYSDASDGFEFRLLRKLVQYAVSHGAQHFVLKPFNCHRYSILLLDLFDSISGTLRTLELASFDLDCRPVLSGFQLLTTLELYSCRFLADQALVEPFSQFPCLSDLVLKDCSWRVRKGDDDRPVRLKVSGIELDRLILEDIKMSKLEIFAPKLKYFKLISEAITVFLELNLSSLVHADFRSVLHYGWDDDDDYDIEKEHLVFMFHALHNVEYLTLCKEMSKAICRKSKYLEQQPCPFTKLKKLNLEYDSSEDIPYKVMNNYSFNGSSNARLDIMIQNGGVCQVVMMQRLS